MSKSFGPFDRLMRDHGTATECVGGRTLIIGNVRVVASWDHDGQSFYRISAAAKPKPSNGEGVVRTGLSAGAAK